MSNDTSEYDLIGFAITRVPHSHKGLWCFMKPSKKEGSPYEVIMCHRSDYEPSKEHTDFIIKFSWGWKDTSGMIYYDNGRMHFISQRQKEEAYRKELNQRYKENNNSWPITDM